MVLGGAAVTFCHAGLFSDNFELAARSQQFTEALVRKDTRTMYRLFAPGFRAENSFARFDSAVNEWYDDRRIVKASRRVNGIDGPSATVSTGVWFEDEDDYTYLFQSWINDGRSWNLLWVSKIIDQSFQYGRSDTAALHQVAEQALRYVVSKAGRARLHLGDKAPDTLVVVRRDVPEEGPMADIDGVPVVWLTTTEVADTAKMPDVPFFVALGLVRITGDVAMAVVDLYAREAPRSTVRSHHGVEVYLERRNGTWAFLAVGKVFTR